MNTNESLRVDPDTFEMATTDKLPLGFNTAPLLSVGQSPAIQSVSLIDLAALNVPITLPDSANVQGNIIVQKVRGSSLQAGHRYVLTVIFQAAPDDTTFTMILIIECPE